MMFYKFFLNGIIGLFLFYLSPGLFAKDACDLATDLLFRAYHLYHQDQAVSHQKLLFERALELCPNRPNVQTVFASILEKEGEYTAAVNHYKQAIRYDKKFYEAWHGLGETYYKQKRYPFSLQAHAQACHVMPRSKSRIAYLLEDNRYAMTRKNDLIDYESLLFFYDPQRLKSLNASLKRCGFDHEVEPLHIFINFNFPAGAATFSQENNLQLDEIAAALKQLQSPTIIVYGHTDSRGFNDIFSFTKNKELNQKLSEERALAVREALIQRGVEEKYIKTVGLGDEQPLFPRASQLSLNRRIEIRVEYPMNVQSSKETEEVDEQ